METVMFFDTHAHYDDEAFDTDRDQLLSALPENGIGLVVNPASNLASALAARALAEKYEFLYFAAGIHPHEAAGVDSQTLKEIKFLLGHPKCVAVGEIGLDYHYDFSPRETQQEIFRAQMGLARQCGKKVIIHEREACADCMAVVNDFPDVTGVFHCFSGSWETARELLDKGWYLSFGGAITFKNARRAVEVVEKMPLERLMLETDCPYMAPVPHRGQRNSSLYLSLVAEKAAQIHHITASEVETITWKNAKHFFGIA